MPKGNFERGSHVLAVLLKFVKSTALTVLVVSSTTVVIVLFGGGVQVALGSWALGELFAALGRATLWVRTLRYDTVAKDGVAQHVAALGGFAPPQVDTSLTCIE